MRLIDADAYQYPGDLINEPTVDAVPVVRCKECKNKGLCAHHNGRYIGQFDDDDFCSYGERKEGADNG